MAMRADPNLITVYNYVSLAMSHPFLRYFNPEFNSGETLIVVFLDRFLCCHLRLRIWDGEQPYLGRQ